LVDLEAAGRKVHSACVTRYQLMYGVNGIVMVQRFFADFSPQRSEVNTRAVHVTIVVGTVAFIQVPLPTLWFSPTN
jgi:hypothetical protein